MLRISILMARDSIRGFLKSPRIGFPDQYFGSWVAGVEERRNDQIIRATTAVSAEITAERQLWFWKELERRLRWDLANSADCSE